MNVLDHLHVARLDPDAAPAEARSPETTTPTTLAEWARESLKPLITAS